MCTIRWFHKFNVNLFTKLNAQIKSCQDCFKGYRGSPQATNGPRSKYEFPCRLFTTENSISYRCYVINGGQVTKPAHYILFNAQLNWNMVHLKWIIVESNTVVIPVMKQRRKIKLNTKYFLCVTLLNTVTVFFIASSDS